MAVDRDLAYEIEQFLYQEAALLDQRRFHEWLDLFTDDVRYWMPLRTTRGSGEADELSGEHESAYFDEDKSQLAMRVAKLDTGYAWAEEPPSRTRHLVSNVRVRPGDKELEYLVDCYFIVYRSRMAADQDWWVGRREDVLRGVDGQWKIARRTIVLDQAVLLSKNLSVFF